MASKFKNLKNSIFSRNLNNDEKDESKKCSTPLPDKAASISSLYASTPALSTPQQQTDATSGKQRVSSGRLKIVRDFFRSKFNFHNKTSNKCLTQSTNALNAPQLSTASGVVESQYEDAEEEEEEDDDDGDGKAAAVAEKLKKHHYHQNLKERLLKSKINDKRSYVDAQPVSEDEGIISKTPDSLKNYLNAQQSGNITKNSSFGYSSESFASLGSIDSSSNAAASVQENSDALNKNASLMDSSMHKAKIHAASYRNYRKVTKAKRDLNTSGDFLNSSMSTSHSQNETTLMTNSFIMDPIEEISKSKDDSYLSSSNTGDDAEEATVDRNAFKRLLQVQLTQQPPVSAVLNKSNTQLDKANGDTAVPVLPPPTSNELLEKMKNRLRSTVKQQIPAVAHEADDFKAKLLKRSSVVNNSSQQTNEEAAATTSKRNSIDLDLMLSSNTRSSRSADDPVYDNFKSFLQIEEQQPRLPFNEICKKLNEPRSGQSRKTTIITSALADTGENATSSASAGSKLGHSKSMKISYISSSNNSNTSTSNNLTSPSATDVHTKHKQLNNNRTTSSMLTTTTNEPSWRDLALKKQSAWVNNGSAENLLNARAMTNSCIEPSTSKNEENLTQNHFGKVKSLIKDLEK